MKTRMKRVLALILTLMMFLSVSTQTFALGGGIGIGDGWGREIGDGDVRDFDPGVEPEDKEEYDYFSAFDQESGINVTVEAPMGSLPTLAEVRVKAISPADVQDAVDALLEDGSKVLVAMDISFWLDDIEIEPEEPVRVKIAAPELEGKTNLQVIHFPDDAEEPETVQLIGDEDLSFALGTNEVAFLADSFSTYAITWGGDNTVTIHWGYYVDGVYQHFEEQTTLDPNASNVSLNALISGYLYSGAFYRPSDSTQEYPLSSEILTKVDDNTWTIKVMMPPADAPEADPVEQTVTLASGDDIYTVYVEKASTYTPPSPAPADVKGPITNKNVSSNGDGTYKIRLDVTGQVDHSVTRVGANVIVVLDVTQSMSNTISGGGTRMAAARSALQTLINALNPGTGEDQNLINFTVVTFANSANFSNGLAWTQDKTAMLDYAGSVNYNNNYPGGYGTCWQAGLYGGISRANDARTNATLSGNQTYVIFVTDGDPNGYYTRSNDDGGPTNNPGYQTPQTADFVQNAYTYAVPNAVNLSTMVGHRFYGVYCGNETDGGYGRLQNLMSATNQGNSVSGTFINGTNSTAIQNEFRGIAQTIVADLAAANTTVDDGIPTLADVSSAVSGSVNDAGYDYYISYPLTLVTEGENAGKYSYSYKTVNANNEPVTVTEYIAASTVENNAVNREPGANEPEYVIANNTYSYIVNADNTRSYYYTITWDGAPGASYSSSNGVTWNLSPAGVLADKTIYSITFDVWPSQEAYDLLANLNNGMEGWTLDALDDATREQLVVTVTKNNVTENFGYSKNAAGNYVWTGDRNSGPFTTAEFMQYFANATNVEYNILTNTHLYTTYDYNGQSYSDPPENGLVSGAMLLEDQTIDIIKYWHNDLDAQQAEQITLTVTKDGEEYLDVVMGEPTQVPGEEHEWVQVPATADSTIYISCGIMTVDGNNNLTMNTTGHDYSVVETDGSPWFWDLTAYTYHPMVINAENKMLILVTDELKAGEIYNDNFPSDITDTNPADLTRVVSTVDGRTYYRFNGKLYVQTDAPTNTLRADNDRRSNLQIAKAVTEGSPEDELFTFQVTMENTTTPYKGDDNYDPDYHTFWFVVLNDPEGNCDLERDTAGYLDPEDPDPDAIMWEEDGLVVEGATLEQKTNDQGEPIEGEYTGYYWFDNVDGGTTVTIKIKPGWRICFTSITKDTDYTVVEPNASMPDGFMLDNVETSAHCNKSGDVATAGVVSTTDPALVEGSIDASNSDYRVYYTNRFVGFFYVYHSSDCTLERFPAATEGALYGGEKTFSITDLTRDGTLYGGYYSDYAGKSSGFDAAAAKALDYSGENDPADEGGTTYSTAYILESNRGAWSASAALTVNGFAMAPVANTVYYLKEVPTAYLQPYFHYTYSKETFDIFDGWLLSAIDDCLYQETGFVIVSEDDEASVCSTLTVKTANTGGSTVLLKPESIFRSKGVQSGYLSYLQVLKDGSPTMMQEGDRVLQYWVTPDGLIVTGVAGRSYSGLGNKNDLGKTDLEDVTSSTVAVFGADDGELPVEP